MPLFHALPYCCEIFWHQDSLQGTSVLGIASSFSSLELNSLRIETVGKLGGAET
jgi:hypothetical protein